MVNVQKTKNIISQAKVNFSEKKKLVISRDIKLEVKKLSDMECGCILF